MLVHSCVHKIFLPKRASGKIYQQNHCDVYLSSNAGDEWKDISPNNQMRHGFATSGFSNSMGMAFFIP